MSIPSRSKGKIGVLIEDHFDEIEYREFNQYFPERGYEVVYLSHLWGQILGNAHCCQSSVVFPRA